MRLFVAAPVVVMSLLLAACGEKPAEKSELVVQEELQVIPIEQACDDASIKNSLVAEVRAKIDMALIEALNDNADAKKLDLARLAQSNLSMLSVDLQNVQSDQDACQAQLLLSLSQDELAAAEKYFKKRDVSMETLLDDASAEYVDGYVVGDILYSKAGDKVVLDDHLMLPLFAKLTAAAAHTMASDKKVVNINGRSAVTVTPLEPTISQPAVQTRTIDIAQADKKADEAKTQPTDNPDEASNKNLQTEDKSSGNKTESTTKTVTTKVNTTKANDTKTEPNSKSADSKNSSTQSVAEKGPAAKESSETMVIVQTDETY